MSTGATYKFIGTTNTTDRDLSLEDYSDRTRWELGKPVENQFGVGGTFYKYIGTDTDDLNLSTQDYTDTSKWEQITRNLDTEDFSNETYWAKTSSITALSVAVSVGAAIAGSAAVWGAALDTCTTVGLVRTRSMPCVGSP